MPTTNWLDRLAHCKATAVCTDWRKRQSWFKQADRSLWRH